MSGILWGRKGMDKGVKDGLFQYLILTLHLDTKISLLAVIGGTCVVAWIKHRF